jgi:DNA-binding CsgD family transcriptional regulator
LRAGARGGYAARASILARAAELTADASERDRRLFAAAESAFTAGALLQARSLLERVDAAGDDTESSAFRRGMTLLLRASLTVGLGDPDGFAVAPAIDLAAATVFMEDDPNLVRDALYRACRQAITAEGLIKGTSVTEIAGAIREVGAIGATHPDPVLEAFATLATGNYETAVPHMRQAIAMLLSPETPPEVVLERYIVGVTYCTVLWDDRSRIALLERGADLARTTGALWNLDSALFARSMAETIAGRLEAADRYVVEGHDIRSALGATQDVWQVYRHPELLAWHGETGHTRAVIQGTAEGSAALGIGAMVSIAKIGLMVLAISEGQYAEASAVGRDLMDGEILYVHSRVLPDLVEAAFRSGDQALAEATLESLSIRATASGTPSALGLLARSQALLAADDGAEPIHRRAIDILSQTEAIADLARARLLYGEWLRRQNRRRDARDELRTALAMFEDMGASGFAERTRTELAATGERARKRSVETLRDLTPQEDQIARLAALGDTNAEIGERLFISATTVDYHLRKVYQKLDIGSRRDLRSRYRAT